MGIKLKAVLSAAILFCLALNACSDAAVNNDTVNSVKAVQEHVSLSPELKTLIDTAMEGTHGYDITRELTTEVGPRLAGTDAEARARDWAVDKFKELGLQNVRIEPFTIPGWVRGVETASILSPYPQDLYITALGGSVATPDEGVKAEIAYFPTFEDLESAPEGGLEGKIVFISGKMEKAPDGAGYGPANRKRRSGATEAGRRGAIAVVIRSVGTDSHRFPHTGQMRYSPDVKPIPIGALSAPDADQLERMLTSGETVSLHLTMTPRAVGDLPSGNVVGEIVGTERPEEIVLISGHLDSWDLGTGAIDDGAGIGISAGAAQVLIESGLKPKRTIRVVAFGAEEVGLLGGFAYAEHHKNDLINHVLATESDFGAGLVYEVQSGAKAGNEVIEAMAKAMGLPMSQTPTNGGPDIFPLFNKGVPAMRFQQDGTDYFDLHHTPDDTFDKIKPEEMAQNVAAFATMIWLAGNAETNFRLED
ncbi:Zn-dependent M28 family amino/carboxypeptidase [Litorimonas taeanensis]|uniref:Carboxypeptidase Q n=2 Tax=Litorimonas taeanensis TaxID=568099 RepID=A0A420WK81_9PROT|nr:Zn-dependent M28 family amino/carboxypeptidase [Litorimonas taeanensis]